MQNKEVIIVANNELFKKIVNAKDPEIKDLKEFAKKYELRTIEFKGNVRAFAYVNEKQSRFDMLFNTLDYEEDTCTGPNFKFDYASANEIGLEYGEEVPYKVGCLLEIIMWIWIVQNWIINKAHKENGIVIEGYTAQQLSSMSRLLDGEGVYMLLIELRENSLKTKKRIEDGFVMKQGQFGVTVSVDFEKRETVTLGELLPKWWGDVKISE